MPGLRVVPGAVVAGAVAAGAAARLWGEPGVSYLVQVGRERVLFDTGPNLFRRSRSALVDNAEALGVDRSNHRALLPTPLCPCPTPRPRSG